MTDCNDFGVTFSPQKCLSQTFYPNSPLLSFFKNKNNQKVRLESINDIKKHFQTTIRKHLYCQMEAISFIHTNIVISILL